MSYQESIPPDTTQTIASLPTYDDLFPPQQVATARVRSILKSFSLVSLFGKATPARQPLDHVRALQPLFDLDVKGEVGEAQVVNAHSAFAAYLGDLKNVGTDLKIDTEDTEKVLVHVMRAYLRAFTLAARAVWTDQVENEALERSLQASIQGGLLLYRHLPSLSPQSTLPDSDPTVHEHELEQVRKALLASPFSAAGHHNTFVPLFDRARDILQSLQLTTRPLAHSKYHPRTSITPQALITDDAALHVMSLLQVYAEEVEKVEKLVGPVPAKTKAQKEEDKRRPLRIGIEARFIGCDVALSMANRDIHLVKIRARGAGPTLSGEAEEDVVEPAGEEEDVKPVVTADEDEDDLECALVGAEAVSIEQANDTDSKIAQEASLSGTKWEQVAEKALIECLLVSKALMEGRQGGVLTDRIERQHWLDIDIPTSPPASPKSEAEGTESEVADSEEDESEEDEDDDVVDAYTCPLRTLFRLHDRYEEQRLAVWLTLPTDTRPGMGTYMRGEEGKVGSAWDGLGLLLMLDYDSNGLLSFGLSGDKLDKWIDLASKRNSKKIRRKGRKAT